MPTMIRLPLTGWRDKGSAPAAPVATLPSCRVLAMPLSVQLAHGLLGLGGREGGRRREVERQLVLEDLLDHQLQVRAALPLDQRPCALHQLHEAALNQGAQLETSSDLVGNCVALERFDHR